MNMTKERLEQIALMLLRVVVGLLFVQHGGMKLLGWLGGMPGGMKVSLASEIGVAGILELVGGGLILIGLLTRPVAFILSGEMAVAYFQAHAPHGLSPIVNHGEPAVLYCFLFLYLAVRGAGEYSFDALLGRRRQETGTGVMSTPAAQI
jgi:putative oxidoreductase